MGDRTTTTITVQLASAAIVDIWINDNPGAIQRIVDPAGLVTYLDEDSRSGNLDRLERLLEENAIPFDANWERDRRFEEGVKTVRIKRHPSGELITEQQEWSESDEVMDLKTLSGYIEAFAIEELEAEVNSKISKITASSSLRNAVFFEEHSVLLNRLKQNQRIEAVNQQMKAAFDKADNAPELITEAGQIIVELIYDKRLDDELSKQLEEVREAYGVIHVRHEFRRILDAIQRSYAVTENAAGEAGFECYDYDWMPAFLKAVLSVDVESGAIALDGDFLAIAWEMGLARKED